MAGLDLTREYLAYTLCTKHGLPVQSIRSAAVGVTASKFSGREPIVAIAAPVPPTENLTSMSGNVKSGDTGKRRHEVRIALATPCAIVV